MTATGDREDILKKPEAFKNPHGFQLDHGAGMQFLVRGQLRVSLPWGITEAKLRETLRGEGLSSDVIEGAVDYVDHFRVDFHIQKQRKATTS
ncbi:MAG: hypothetical protein RI911_743 [Candidatus Parcubacteria bacterium]